MNRYLRIFFVIEMAVCFAAATLHLLEVSFFAIWGIFAVGAITGEEALFHSLLYGSVVLGWLGFFGVLHLIRLAIRRTEASTAVASFKVKLYLIFWVFAIALNSIPIFADWEGKPLIDPSFTWLVLLPAIGTLHLIYVSRGYLGIPSWGRPKGSAM